MLVSQKNTAKGQEWDEIFQEDEPREVGGRDE
jgi:hypothetical protein